jgi:hypothetical protein
MAMAGINPTGIDSPILDETPVPLAALSLIDLPTNDPAFARAPLPYLAAARQVHPWLARCAAGIVVHQHAAMDALLRRDEVMGTSFTVIVDLMHARNSAWGRFTEALMTGSMKGPPYPFAKDP